MEHLEKLTEIVDKEISHVVNNGGFRDAQQVHTIYELIDIAKDAYCIMDAEEGGGSYAEDGMGGNSMRGSYRGSYDGGSYARGRRGARRDSMGRYSREGGSYRMGGYSRADEEITRNLEKLMEQAPNEEAKEGYRRLLEQMN